MREIRLLENLTDVGSHAVGHEMRLRTRPRVEEGPIARDTSGTHFIDRVTVRVLDCRSDNLGEGLAAELAQRQQSRVHHARDQRRHNACDRDHALQSAGIHLNDLEGQDAARSEHLRRRELGHGPHPRDRKNFAGLVANQDGRFAAHSEVRELGDGRREHSRHARVYRVTAFVERAHAGFGCVFAAGGNRSVRSPRRLANGMIHFAAGLRDTNRCKKQGN